MPDLPGTDLATSAASALDSVTAAEASVADTTADTTQAAEHTPAPESTVDESEAHITWLRDNLDKIPAEKLQFADKKFQPDYTRRLNLLNNTKAGIESNAKAMLDEAGVQIPDGKTVNDLIYDDGGKGFVDLLKSTVKSQMAPILNQVETQRQNSEYSQYMNLAQEAFPVVKENFAEVLKLVDSNPDLTALATKGGFGGKAIPYVMAGVGYELAYNKQVQEIAALKKQLDATKVAAKVGSSSTKASGGAAKTPTGETKSLSLEQHVALAAKRLADSQG